jgi:xylulokinase
MANVLGVKLESPACEQGPGMGGAMLAMVACGAYESVQAACDAIVKTASVLEPDPELTALYEAQYQRYLKIHDAVKMVFDV